jgi:hypothetical protein
MMYCFFCSRKVLHDVFSFVLILPMRSTLCSFVFCFPILHGFVFFPFYCLFNFLYFLSYFINFSMYFFLLFVFFIYNS